MSWWDDEDDMLGDEPADRIRGAWRTALARRRERGQSLPGHDEAFESYAAALAGAALQPAFSAMVLRLGDAKPRQYRGEQPDEELQSLFAEAVARIEAAYRNHFQRAPHASEMVKTLEFVVSAGTSSYVSDLTDADGEALRLQAQ